MKIAVAQTKPIIGDIAANAVAHQKLIQLAIPSHAQAVFFPELSLTGYQPNQAKHFTTLDYREHLAAFQLISDKGNICIGLGMPTPGEKGILISMIIFQPGMPRQTYSKQQLHTDELPFFTPGNYQTLLSIGNCKVAPAICYESLQTTHAENAYQLGAAIYVASVAKSQTGISKALQHYPEIARRFSMPVLMANAVGYCDNFESAGQTAVWDKNGNLTAQLEEKSAGIIVFDTTTATASVNLIAD